jgi:type I restriction enzyme S subunit
MSNKVIAKTMEQGGKPGLKPKLRFPEFRDAKDWEVDPLGSRVTKVGSGMTPNGGESNYKRSGRPFVRSQNVGWGELILDDVVFIDDELHTTFAATEVRLHDVLLNITGASIGRSAVADSRIAGGNVNQHVCIIRSEEKALIPTFLNQYLLSNYGQSQIDSFQAGGNRQGLNFAQVRSFSIPLPPTTAEQEKIANCLTSVDELIAAQARKVDTLKAHKKGLMQQLFPREGETIPRLRFPEFQNGPEWNERTLVSACQMQAGKFVSASDIQDEAGEGLYPCYGGNGLRGYTKTYTHSGKYPLIGRQGALCGNVKLGSGQFHATEHAVVATPQNGIDVDWLFYTLDVLNLNQYATGQAQPGLSVDVLEEVSLAIPDQKSEQLKIARCLASLDGLTTAQTQKLELLKTHKKGLMQQLFPSPEEVEA